MGPSDEPTTQELRALQERKADEEGRRAEQAALEDEERTHARRAEKAEYLKAKLEEQEASEE